MRRLSEVALAVLALAVTGLVVGFGVSDQKQRSLSSEASSWRGLVGGGHPAVSVGQRVLVVLRSPSMAERVVADGERHLAQLVIEQRCRLVAHAKVHDGRRDAAGDEHRGDEGRDELAAYRVHLSAVSV